MLIAFKNNFEGKMRGIPLLILLPGLFFLTGCSNNKMLTAPETKLQTQSSFSKNYVNGTVAASFADNISKADAEKFISGLNLTTDIIYGFNGKGDNIIIVNVPAGQEESWAEMLSKFPVIQSANRITNVTISAKI